jgi:hypothetical protein
MDAKQKVSLDLNSQQYRRFWDFPSLRYPRYKQHVHSANFINATQKKKIVPPSPRHCPFSSSKTLKCESPVAAPGTAVEVAAAEPAAVAAPGTAAVVLPVAVPGTSIGIRDILVRIRIRLLSLVTIRMQKKIFFIFFPYNLPSGTLSSVFKAKRGRNGSKKPKTYFINVY